MIKQLGKLLKQIVRLINIKWVKGECRHLCATCKYRSDCFNNFE